MVKKTFTVLLFLAAVSFVSAENNISVEMELYNTVMRSREIDYSDSDNPVVGDSYWAYSIAGSTGFSFNSTGSREVKAGLSFDFNLPDISGVPVVTLDKAFVKARFSAFRVTLGKTRLSWGDGYVFNSGDVIFGSTSPYVNLTESEVRSETTWMTAVNIPLGRFSFIEGLITAPELLYSDTSLVGAGDIRDLGAGLRLYTKISGIKLESGYYFDGTDDSVSEISVDALHRPYVSFQGNFGPDFYLSSSLAIPLGDDDNLETVVKETFNISFGLFHVQEVGYSNNMTFRLESMILPFLSWSEDDGEAGSYAMLIYPEISFALGQTMNFSLRSIISPVDLSARFTAGFSWNIFEGFNLLTYAILNGGDGDDTFSWSKDKDSWVAGVDSMDGVALLTGINYIY